LTSSDVGSSGRGDFHTDTTLSSGFYEVTTGDYTGSGYDRGHMCPSADRTVNQTDNDLVFYMSNIIPQSADNNEGPWEGFESYCRTLAAAGDELLITCGPSTFTGSRIKSGKVAIPGYT
jgi:endonuclease G